MLITRLYDFQDGTKAVADQVDDEFNQILALVNGKLQRDNLDSSVELLMKDPKPTLADFPANEDQGVLRFCLADNTFYRYDTGVWNPVIRLVQRADLSGVLITELDGLRSDINLNQSDIQSINNSLSTINSTLTTHTGNISDLQTNKADKTYVDNNLALKADKSSTYAKSDVDALLTNKADKSSVYTIAQTDAKLNAKADTNSVYDKTTVDSKLSAKANTSDVYTKAQSDGAYEKKVIRGNVAPSDTTVLWLDTSLTPAGLKYYNGTTWTLTGDGVGTVGSGVTINDTTASSTTTYSSNKIESRLTTKANTGDAYTKTESDGKYEPVINPKGTAFNKDFAGSGVATTVSHSDHDHTGVYQPTGNYIVNPATKSSGQYLEFDGTNWVAVNAPSGGSGGSGLPVVSSSLPGTASVDKVEFEKDVNKFIKSVPNTAGATAILPKTFTSATLNGYTISESSYYTTNPGWKVADGSATTYWTVANANIPAWILFSLPSPKVVCKYSIMGQNAATTPDPRSWKLEGSNDQTNWVLCDNQQDVNTWANAEDKSFNVQNPGSYQYYRITISNYLNMASGTSTMQIAEIQLFEPASYSWVEITDRDVSTLQTKVANMYQMVASNAIPTPTNIDQILYVKDLNQWQKSIPASGTAYTIATPSMTGNVSGSVITSASDYNTSYEPWKAFDINTASYWISATTSGAWLQVDFGVGNEKGIVKYATNIGTQTLTRAPKNFRLQGSSNGTTWVDLDTQTGITYTASTDMVFYPKYPGVYRFYRLYVDANGGDTTYTALAELKLWTASTLAWTPIQDPTYVTDFTIKKSVPTIVLDAGRASTSSIQWNGNATNEYGINFKHDGTNRFQITSTGINVWDANSAGLKAVRHAGQNYAFRAYTSSATLTVETTTNTYHKLILEQRDYEITSTTAYDTTNGKYVAPAPGVYQLNLKIRGSGMDNGTRWKFMIYKNGVFEATVGAGYYPNGADIDFGGSLGVRLAKNDYVEIYYNVSNSVASSKVIYNGRNETYFDGHLAIPE